MKIKIDELKEKVISMLEPKFGAEAAALVTEYLVWADMSGNSTQGVIKLLGSDPLGDIVPTGEILIERETKLSKNLNANNNPAPLVAQHATKHVIDIANEHGFGIVGVRNTRSSNGSQAFYVEKMAQQDLIGIMCSRSPAATTGFGSIDPLFGTNPVGFGFPTSGDPLVFDMATSAMTFYGLVLAKAQGLRIPEDMAIDKDGNSTTNPEAAMGGALLSFDRGYKGAGLGMMVEMLAGPLVGAAYIDNKTFTEEWGSLFIAIDPDLLVDRETFKKNASDLINKVKSSRHIEEIAHIRLPGERAQEKFRAALESDEVEIDDNIARELRLVD